MRALRSTPTAARPAPLALAALLAVAGAGVLGGCRDGGASGHAAAAARPKAREAAAASASAVPTRPCATADLAVRPARHEVRQGLDIERFTVAAAGPAGCTLHGSPRLSPKGPLSDQEPGTTVDLAVSQLAVPESVGLAAGDGATVALLPGRAASFYLAWYRASSVVCVQSNAFGFNAPGDTAYGDMRLVRYSTGSLCDGIFYVSPLFPDAAAG